MQVEGLTEGINRLKEIGTKESKKMLRTAITKGIRPVRNATKARAPVRTGLLKRNMTSKVKTYKTGDVVGIVGPKSIKVKGSNPARYAHLVEGGHGGSSPAPAHPFFFPAVQTAKKEAETIVINECKKFTESLGR